MNLPTFSLEWKNVSKVELENKVRMLFKKFEYDDLLQFCFDVIRKEPEWHYMWSGICGCTYMPKYEPPRGSEIEDFIWDHVNKNKIMYRQLQDYAVRHRLVPQNYFPDRADLTSNCNILGFSKSVKSAVLKKQEGYCAVCTRYSPPYFFDHKDENHSNSSPKNCQALCATCYKRKNLGHD